MQSVSAPLDRLHEDGSWFARAHELRLWLVRCDDSTRKSALALIPGLEFHADNHAAWPVLPDAHTEVDDGWQPRANRLAADWARRVEAFAAAGTKQGAATAVDGPAGLAAFVSTTAAVLAAMREPLTGAVIVLAPGVLERPRRFESALLELLGEPRLARARWVVLLDVDAPPLEAVREALGGRRSLVTDCTIDRAQQRRDLTAMLAPGDPARFGTAGPAGVRPPPRVDDPPPLPAAQRDAALRAAGVDPALLTAGPEIRAKVLGAAIAMLEGRGLAAVQQQREACGLCERLGLHEVALIARITLASYLSGLDRRPEAIRELQQALALAQAHALLRGESQVHLALGLLHGLDGKHDPAAHAYADAARTAEAADEPMLAIEAWRMAGQIAAQRRQEARAVAAFREALRVASDAPPSVQQGSSAAEAARRLAAIYERRGMAAQCASLHRDADALERGEGLDARQ